MFINTVDILQILFAVSSLIATYWLPQNTPNFVRFTSFVSFLSAHYLIQSVIGASSLYWYAGAATLLAIALVKANSLNK